MQALRHASRRALHIPVMQKTVAASVKAYSSEVVSSAPARKTKKERFELVKQFIDKFKAANNGQLPGISLLRKEVGGKYETLKEAFEELSKGQDKPDTSKQIGEPNKTEEKTQEFAAAVKDGVKKKSPLKEDSLKDKKEMRPVSKGSKAVKTVDSAQSRTTSKDTKSVMPVKSASKLDNGLVTEDDDDDSDVAAPEYSHSSSLQMAHQKMEMGAKASKGEEKVLEIGPRAHLKNDLKKQNDGQAIKAKLADIKQPEVDIKQPVVHDGGRRIELPHKARDTFSAVDDKAPKHLPTDGSKPLFHASLTTVVRIVNLPQHITASKLKAICELVASVHEVDLRRGHNADVHFNVSVDKMADVITRLRKLSVGPTKMRVFAAQKLFCGNNANGEFKPQDVHHYRMVRNSLFSAIEQRLKYLSWQVQDFRELQAMKLAR